MHSFDLFMFLTSGIESTLATRETLVASSNMAKLYSTAFVTIKYKLFFLNNKLKSKEIFFLETTFDYIW